MKVKQVIVGGAVVAVIGGVVAGGLYLQQDSETGALTTAEETVSTVEPVNQEVITNETRTNNPSTDAAIDSGNTNGG